MASPNVIELTEANWTEHVTGPSGQSIDHPVVRKP